MNLLDDLKQAINHSNLSISDILRKALELGYILNNQDLINWTEKELNGYDKDDDIPTYRIINAQNYGHFSGSFGRRLENYPIPTMNLPDIVRKYAESNEMRQGVCALQSLINGNKNGILTCDWPGNYIVVSQSCLYEGMNLTYAYSRISTTAVAQIIDEVKTRLLKFILVLQRDNPNITSNDDLMRVNQDEISQNYRSNISGSVCCTEE